MADDTLQVNIKSDSSQLQAGLSDASQAVKDGVGAWNSTFKNAESAITGNCTNIIENIMKVAPAVAIAAGALATLAVTKESISSFEQYADEVRHLHEFLGISTQEASQLKVALDVLGIGSETYLQIAMRLERQLRTHADEYTRLGVSIRDVNTNAFLPTTQIIANVIEKMREYKAGTDQIKVAMDLLGPRGAQAAFELMHLQEAMSLSRAEMDKLGLSMSEDGVAAAHKFEMQTHLMNEEWKAVKINIGQQVMPQLSGLIASLNQTSGPVINALIIALKYLIDIIEHLATVLVYLYDIAKGVFVAIGTFLGGIAAAIVQALSGDFSGAWNTFKEANHDATSQYDKTLDELYASGVAHQKRMEALWNKPTDSSSVPSTSGSKEAPEDSATAKKNLEGWVEAQHAKQELLKQNADEWFAIEDKVLKRLKTAYGENSKEYQSELNRKNKMTEEFANRQREIESIDAEMKKDSAEHAIAMKKEELASKVALGQISKKQEIETLRSFEDQQYQLELKALDDKLKVYENDKVRYEKLLLDKQKLTEKYELSIAKLNHQETQQYYNDWKQTMMSVSGLFEHSLDQMLTSQKSFGQQIRALLNQLAMFFINDYVKKSVDNWLFGEQKQYAISLLFSKLKKALGLEEAAAGIEAKTVGAAGEFIIDKSLLMADAATGAAGAASSQASIPYVGPYLAAVESASIFSLIMGLASYIPSMDIGGLVPAGVNPITQIHAGEMVLPEYISKGLQNVIKSGAVNSGGASNNYNIQALDTKSFMSRNGAQILKGIKGHMRNMHRRF